MARFRRSRDAAVLDARVEHQHTFAFIDALARRASDADPRRVARALLGVVVALLALGFLLQVGHASTTVAPERFSAAISEQVGFRAGALGVLLLAWGVGPLVFRYGIPLAALLSCVGLALVYVPGIGDPINGARRWIRLAGVSLQPSEFARVLVVLWVARRCHQLGGRVENARGGYLPMLLFGLAVTAAIVMEPDLGGALLFLACFVCTLWVGGARPQHVAGSMVTVLIGTLLLMSTVLVHARERIAVWVGDSTNTQVERSVEALGSGQLLGMGFTHGGWRQSGLQYHQTDYALSLVGEEFGLVGVLLVIALFIAFALLSLTYVRGITDRFRALAAFGLLLSVALQAMLHIQVTTGLAPPKGLNLPFISDGGSSLLASCLAVGLALSASRGMTRSSISST